MGEFFSNKKLLKSTLRVQIPNLKTKNYIKSSKNLKTKNYLKRFRPSIINDNLILIEEENEEEELIDLNGNLDENLESLYSKFSSILEDSVLDPDEEQELLKKNKVNAF
jgi:hypothetical protein